MFEHLFSKKTNRSHTIGAKIREIRKRRGISSAELAEKCHVTGASIRNYENDTRTPSDSTLETIAGALEVHPSSLSDRKIESIADVMQILFEIERTGYIVPEDFPVDSDHSRTSSGTRAINEYLNEAIQKWKEKHDQWIRGEITDDDYWDWQDSFPIQYEVATTDSSEEPPMIMDYRQFALGMLLTLRGIYFSSMDLAFGALEDGNISLAKTRLKAMDRGMESFMANAYRQLAAEPQLGFSALKQGIYAKEELETGRKKEEVTD